MVGHRSGHPATATDGLFAKQAADVDLFVEIGRIGYAVAIPAIPLDQYRPGDTVLTRMPPVPRYEPLQPPQNCLVASRAPSVIAASFAHTTSGSTAAWPTQVPKPQSLPAMTLSQPTRLA